MLPILNLNKHPKDCENLSLTDALNVRLSNDGSCLQSENAIYSNEIIEDYIANYYGERYNIIKLIPCNTELIIITISNSNKNNPDKNIADIFRYNEDLKQIKLVYENFEYHKGKINGTFTYNVNNELIVAISEYDGNEDVPLKTINFGKFEDDKEILQNELLPINPEIKIPDLDYNYIKGNLPYGWYYLFIRYKINNNDYTKWFPISEKILVAELDKQNIIKYYDYHENVGRITTQITGVYDYFINNNVVSNESIELILNNLDTNYKFYQIGLIFNKVDDNKCFITNDINIESNIYKLDLNYLHEHDINNIIESSFNLYNVKNIINYQNRLYISNYKEKDLFDYDTSDILLSCNINHLFYNDYKKLLISTNEENEENEIIEANTGFVTSGNAEPTIYKDLEIDGEIYNTSISQDIDLTDTDAIYYIYFEEGEFRPDEDIRVLINRDFTIVSENNNKLNIHFYCKYRYLSYYDIKFTYIDFNGVLHETICTYTQVTNQSIGIKIKEINITSKTLSDNRSNISNIINPNNSFNLRKKNTTLIPGEIYSFYIHFIDKYGQYTRGFEIENNIKLFKDYDSEEEILLLPTNGEITYPFVVVKADDYVFNSDEEIILSNDEYLGVYDTYFDGNKLVLDSYDSLIDEDIESINNYMTNKYRHLKELGNITWREIPDVVISTDLSTCYFVPYKNINGKRLFKVPFKQPRCEIYQFDTNYIFTIFDKLIESEINIPEEYIGYYFSYKKYESVCKLTGVLTKYDLIKENGSQLTNNMNDSSYMRFYSSEFDIEDNINLNYNVLRIEKKNVFNEQNNQNEIENLFLTNVGNLNIPQDKQEVFTEIKYYFINKYDIIIASDGNKGNSNLGTYLKIPIIDEIFKTDEIYRVSLLNINNDIYTNEDKKLIKCSNIKYRDDINKELKFTFNGYCTYNSFIIYNYNEFIFDTSENIVYDKNKEKYYGGLNTSKFLTYVQMPVYKEYFIETKEFNNEPQKIAYKVLSELNDEGNKYNIKIGSIVIPQNSLDLFKNKYINPDDYVIKYYQYNNENITYLSVFNKFIRRSDIIKDESLSNSWRRFAAENYKVISENKGNITNLIGIGTYLIVHTEHSMFLFNNDNVLKTQNRDVQLEMPDIFSMDYKELVTSKLGYCGLQDSDAYVLGEFGYIFYDNDAHRLYKFDNGQIDVIDNDIVQFLYKYKPSMIRFAHDQYANRILLNIRYNDLSTEYTKILSYNYKVNKFISFHEYIFHDAVNTKNILYLTRIGLPEIYNIDYESEIRNLYYNKFENGNGESRLSKIDIIINDSYNIIKQLEYIIYKLYKVKVSTADYNNYPVEGYRVPYSGEQIRVFNNEIDTGWLDIKIDMEEAKNIFSNYEKPYWDLGNWNFSYLRNKLSQQLGSDFMSKLYGNYFIVSIMFGDSDRRVEFESLGYNITKDRRI